MRETASRSHQSPLPERGIFHRAHFSSICKECVQKNHSKLSPSLMADRPALLAFVQRYATKSVAAT